jgi:hypothetical protein
MTPDRVVVLSLARRPDRLRAFTKRLPYDWPYRLPRYVPAIDGTTLSLPASWATAGAGAYGCALTHTGELRKAHRDGVEALLVLEDDVVFAPYFGTSVVEFVAELPDDAELVMLGGQHFVRPLKVSANVVRCIDTHRTHGYLIKRSAMPLVAEIWESTADHIDRSARRVQAFVPTYAPEPFLIGQAAGRSDIDGTDHPERFWHCLSRQACGPGPWR